MRLPHFRVRSLMLAVVVVALLLWSAIMGSRSYDHYRRAKEYGEQERGWREIALRNRQPENRRFVSESIDYFSSLNAKYRRAMWHPWSPVAADPHAPGFDQWLEQESRVKKIDTNSHTPAAPSPPK